jgi:hypothetical protein
MNQNEVLKDLDSYISKGVAHYWKTRSAQRRKQEQTGKADQGLRSAVTGGAQMDGFIDLFSELVMRAGIPERYLFRRKAVSLPGFFRPTKEWDLLVVRENILIAAIEAKSQVGPSFGNNFNNRTEEAMGSALDLWTAFREQAYLESPQPFLGYFFMLEDCEASNRPVGVQEPHFKRKPGGYRKPTNAQREASRINKDEFDRWFQQIWNIPGASTRNHPAPFPLELATRLVRMFSFTGDTVLDPFCGSGTTMVAALRNARHSIGVEIDSEYCRMAAGYLKAEDMNLFFKTQFIFEKNETEKACLVKEEQALYSVKPARKRLQ